ncbi:alanyl-tRNA synthetase [Caldalkalibacillus uzonensis]|uniref:Alanine--tRNA ligase n=1 Tax=Caldalkalibacillus uzonensis TaxID=353224 RepID=A0ABU0CT07_9BACI|nr:alanine--tRNA ligase [Caldalkalibacillus uzonensis]MDQ0339549.1 alanyl-tRNA synthetase [Caldalkalibacillus uzonensis]
MKHLTSAQIREMFLTFFKEKGHSIEPSASLIPHDDPSLLWINSGVATLKKYFDGRVIPDNPRIVNCQKSIRTNDIENVGKTARHHTFFEMLGNFSIGDYFKKEAIHWAWEFLTDPRWIGFNPEKLSVTIHPEDDEAFNIWHKDIGLPQKRIIRLEENFWDIGEGPCGPNTEIFYDRGEAYGNDPDDPELYPGGENERYLEIWNLVFSQYNHNPDGSYTPLPKKNIDTGMGLERMASVLQEVPTNFDTDLFQPIIQKTAKLAGKAYGKNREDDVAFKVIADHVRTVAFAIGDGALPSNEGRGYVIRRLLRRAVRYGKVLGINKPFLYQLTPVVGENMGSFYSEVVEKEEFISNVVKTEEERFHETLNEGLSILSSMIEELKAKGEKRLSGKQAFTLYDTYGFPLDLTEDFAGEHGIEVDREGFDREMEAQRERARAARQEVDSMQVQGGVLGDFKEKSEFVGYDKLETQAKVLALVVDDQFVDIVPSGQSCQIILDQTPFYAESGGQVADKGALIADGLEVRIEEVQKGPGGQHVHWGEVVQGSLTKGSVVTAKIDEEKRAAIVKNHTATHLLHQALKDVLGEHVNQAGSLVAPDRLRFDFSHFSAVSAEELHQIESLVNQCIWQHLPVETMYRSLEEAKAMGAMALFGEKYGETVRVVKVGDYSLELCGGCHVRNTAEIGLFKIVSESGIGAGTRRIEAVTGQYAYQHLNRFQALLTEAAAKLKTKLDAVPARIEALHHQLKELERENEALKGKLAKLEASRLLDQVQEVDDVPVLAAKVSAAGMDDLRTRVDNLKQKLGSAVIVLGASVEGKAMIVAGVTKDLVDKGYHAGKLVKEVASICGGGGGGRPDMAQAGGKDPHKLDEAVKTVPELVKSVLQS